jgi:hypothetical protein
MSILATFTRLNTISLYSKYGITLYLKGVLKLIKSTPNDAIFGKNFLKNIFKKSIFL